MRYIACMKAMKYSYKMLVNQQGRDTLRYFDIHLKTILKWIDEEGGNWIQMPQGTFQQMCLL